MSDWRFASRERVRAGPKETNTMEANIPMTAITTKSSMSVKPFFPIFIFIDSMKYVNCDLWDYVSIFLVYTVGWGQDKRTTLRLAQGNLLRKLPARASSRDVVKLLCSLF